MLLLTTINVFIKYKRRMQWSTALNSCMEMGCCLLTTNYKLFNPAAFCFRLWQKYFISEACQLSWTYWSSIQYFLLPPFYIPINKTKVYLDSLACWLFTIFRVTMQTTLNYRAIYYLQVFMADYFEGL